ncbi:MAG: enoyl-CoA hydratase/isomerase family protein, partial [Gemmatimonadetes bacterium]|nr:enoyl-CoA hydratase/isomerase family protein [Gemmatimonadota bacterium]
MTALTLERVGPVAVITFDLPGEPVNKFSRQVKDEFVAVLDQLERDTSVGAAVLLSGKADTFIAGADIEEFLAWTTAFQAEAASKEGHQLLERLERARVPLVAAIHGACLGGGLETALACAYRIATDHEKTVLALPEIQLGLIPGAGGTQRLPHVVGLQAALDMILTGRNIRAKKALQMGLVHEMVHPAILRRVALERANALAAGTLRRNPPARQRSVVDLAMEGNPLGRSVVLKKAGEMALAKSKGHYPAIPAALDAVAAAYGNRSAGFATEARLFGELAATPVCRELIFLFFATTALKKDPGVETPPAAVPSIKSLGVLGAGFMGAGITSVAVQQGVPVRLKDASLERVGKGIAAVRSVLAERVKKRQVTRQQMEDQLLLAGGTVDYAGFGHVDLVIEAVFEDLAVKHQVVRELEAVLDEDAIVASNTSTIPIARIAEASRRPERMLGMHFFSPVHKMPLLEVIVTPTTRADVTAAAVAFGKRLGKTVIVVRDAPGFYVNRILNPYLNEAGRLLDAGCAIDALDAAVVADGFPVGPITLLDEVGLDVAGKVAPIFHEAFGERMAPPASLRAVVEAGRLGRKGKSGFYLYDADGSRGGVDPSVYALFPTGAQRVAVEPSEIMERLTCAVLAEAARCLEEGIIRSPRDGDVGAVFGFGYPPFRGGPFRTMDAIGAGALVTRLERLNDRFPGRFVPADLLVHMARRGERF